jgi:hypothetical protein
VKIWAIFGERGEFFHRLTLVATKKIKTIFSIFNSKSFLLTKKMKKKRIPVPKKTEAQLMYDTDRKCCICQDGTFGDQIHHIDGDPSNNKINNLVFICFNHHNEASITSSLRKKLSGETIKLYKAKWCEEVDLKRKKRRDKFEKKEIIKLSEDEIIRASVKANVIIEIVKIMNEFHNLNNFEEKELLLEKLRRLNIYPDYRISYEILAFLNFILNRPYHDDMESVMNQVFWLTSIYFPQDDVDNEKFLINEIIEMGRWLLHCAIVQKKSLNHLLYGSQIMKISYFKCKPLNKEYALKKIKRVFEEFSNDVEKMDNYERKTNCKTLLDIFEKDVLVYGLRIPKLPRNLVNLVFK